MKVKVMTRQVYHRYAEIEIEVPEMECNDLHEYLWDNEHLWVDGIDDKLVDTDMDAGFGMNTADWTDINEPTEWRFEYGDSYGGHL